MTWASSLTEYNAVAPNMLLYWAFIERSAEHGLDAFNFGRCTPGSGTHRFKQQWGAAEEPLFWYSIPAASSLARSQPDRRASISFLSRTWQHLPLSLTRQVGPRLRGYLIQ